MGPGGQVGDPAPRPTPSQKKSNHHPMPGAGGGYISNNEHHCSDVLGRRPHVHALQLPAPAVLTHPGLLRGQAETPGSCRLTRLVSAGCSPEQVALSAGAAPPCPSSFCPSQATSRSTLSPSARFSPTKTSSATISLCRYEGRAPCMGVGVAGDGVVHRGLRLTVRDSPGWEGGGEGNRPRQRVSKSRLSLERNEGSSQVHARTSIPGRGNSTDNGPEAERRGLERLRTNLGAQEE